MSCYQCYSMPVACMLPCMKPCFAPPMGCCPNCCAMPMNCMMDCCMAMPCCATGESGGMASPCFAKMMQPMMRFMMDHLMHVTDHYNDATYKEVQDFMVPESVNKPFVDAPGTFKEGMEPRMTEVAMGMMGMKTMRMSRPIMAKTAGSEQGITWEKFAEHRGRCCPGYVPKHPKAGDIAPDGEILATEKGADGQFAKSTLLAEAKKLAAEKGSDKVVLSFDAITCPFYRAYAAEDLFKVANGVPILHVYLREAEPCDEFDAGGMHVMTPLKMKRPIYWHKTEADRALAATDTKKFLQKFEGKDVRMWMDTLDDKLEVLYEARPWRWYVLEVSTGKIVDGISLAPFNMAGKIKVIKKACATGTKAPASGSGSTIAPAGAGL